MSISASQIVSVAPSVLSAGGRGLDLNGVLFTPGNRLPSNAMVPFPDAPSVGAYFGIGSIEYAMADIYFLGFNNSQKKPGSLYFMSYPTIASPAWLRGASLAYMTLGALQQVSGNFNITVNGTVYTSGTVNLSAATSFSGAAALIQAGFANPPFAVTFDSLSSAFTITTNATGSAATISNASGSLASQLYLNTGYGATLSQGQDTGVPDVVMSQAAALVGNWATFTTLFEPDTATKMAFAQWNTAQGRRYLYVPWDTDPQAAVAGSSTTFGAQLASSQQDGTAPFYLGIDKAVFIMGSIASVDFTRRNGRATMAFRGQDGLEPDVTDNQTAQALLLNGYNFYGAFATANAQFNFNYPGNVSGQYQWIDSYINQIWMSNQLQLAMIQLLIAAYSIPYNADGYNMIQAAILDPVQQALNFGAIRVGVTLSNLQKALVNEAVGATVDPIITQQGYYLQVVDASPQTRQVRQSPPITLWYADGQSIQQLNLASILVQ